MQYTKKSDKPPVATTEVPETIVHVLGEEPETGDEQQKGAKTDSGPQAAPMFPKTDTWQGKPVTGDYQTIPEDKEAIEENLKTAGEEVQKRFGLETRGVEITPPVDSNKPEEPEEEASGK
jgi:hypothetical protein